MNDDMSGDAPWLQLSIFPGIHDPGSLEDALLAAGAVAVTLEDAEDDPVLEPAPGTTPLWSQTVVTGLFDARTTDIGAIQARLLAELHTGQLPPHRLEPLEDRDWARAWMDNYHPMSFGQRLWVCPSHLTPPQPQAVNVLMDPGMAFGTGTHPSTALCLTWLDSTEVSDRQVIDYGCGSGILAIAAVMLGARHAIAVDIDPQALQATRENAARNRVGDQIEACLPEQVGTVSADIVVANILAGPLLALAPILASRVRPGGRLALAGLLRQHADEVEAGFRQWFGFGPRLQQEDWILLQATRAPADA